MTVAILMDGKALAAERMAQLKTRVDALKARGRDVGLAVVLVGDDPASQVYVRNKGKACEELGILSETVRLPRDIGDHPVLIGDVFRIQQVLQLAFQLAAAQALKVIALAARQHGQRDLVRFGGRKNEHYVFWRLFKCF